ncbi:type I-F CRISPR-associated protein Csy2 [Marinomonas sp. IMCC 4694]|uniref:type I-F CRISPR-associated protein Csy2 n=1 Tax=Marinomonas sp. IMCC 4694 TaxID=2605432 RepID=UPI0011E68967|nr:type I-F CRISPR-associated protein Csy2 [Marinomonas sp. IMCC 4694]TYL47169.1 type I-F CRISPR-associated protein Csy2 [Marinomonas sp. IMCC 4694]
MSGEIKKLLIIPHLRVHNANALSSPFTIGFPAMTAWLGAVHALQRKLNAKNIPADFIATGVVCHDLNLQTHKGSNDFVHSIVGTGNPLDKTGARSSFIEEARCHLDVSLVIQFDKITLDEQEGLLFSVTQLLNSHMKIAGGDIQGFKAPFCLVCEEGKEDDMNKVKRALMPGYVLIERRELMVDAMESGADAIEALIDYLAIHHTCDRLIDEEENETIEWRRHRKLVNDKPAGWLVPIATGFHAISDVGEAKNQRDPDVPHRFAESIVTLGEFKMPHRLKRIEDMLWRYHTEGDVYLCHQASHAHLASATTVTDEDDESEF